MRNPFSRVLAIDLGTANTLIYEKGRGIVVNEPSMVAIKETKGKRRPVAFGAEAKAMLGKTPDGVEVIRPVRTGVIADFEVAGVMLREFMARAGAGSRSLAKPLVMVGVPCGITEIERRAIREAVQEQAREVRLIDEAMAAAIGCELPVTEPTGSVIVDIGGGTTDIAVISLNDVVSSVSIRLGGDALDESIINYMRRRHHLLIGETTAEQVKKTAGSAHPDFDGQQMEVRGRSLVYGAPASLAVTGREVREAMGEVVGQIVAAVRQAIEKTPPEFSADILRRGISLAGGGALVRGLDRRLAQELHLEVTIPKDPLVVVAEGAGRCLDDSQAFAHVWS